MVEFNVSVISRKSILVLYFLFGLRHRNKVLIWEFQATVYMDLGGQGKPLLCVLKSLFLEGGSPLPCKRQVIISGPQASRMRRGGKDICSITILAQLVCLGTEI